MWGRDSTKLGTKEGKANGDVCVSEREEGGEERRKGGERELTEVFLNLNSNADRLGRLHSLAKILSHIVHVLLQQLVVLSCCVHFLLAQSILKVREIAWSARRGKWGESLRVRNCIEGGIMRVSKCVCEREHGHNDLQLLRNDRRAHFPTELEYMLKAVLEIAKDLALVLLQSVVPAAE